MKKRIILFKSKIYRVIERQPNGFKYYETIHVCNGCPVHLIWDFEVFESWEIGQLMGGN